ncbi:MAG: DUF4082 domain-containing protein [Clostridia bacterium]|nr:DUF4082 domain-containing protein [Clostridia bacterium]
MKRISKEKMFMVMALMLTAGLLLGLVSGARPASAAEENVERYTIFGSLEGYDVVVSGEHVYDGQTLGVGTRFSTNENCRITKIRKYFGQEEHGTFVAAIWSGETGELVRSYEWTVESGKNGWEELVLSEPLEIDAGAEYVVEIDNTKESPYYVYVRGYFENTDIAFFDISGGNSVFTEHVGEMPLNAMGANANFLVDVEVEYSRPVPTATAVPTEEPAATEEPVKATDVPVATEAATDAAKPAEGTAKPVEKDNSGNALPIIITAVCAAIVVAVVISIVVMKKRKK